MKEREEIMAGLGEFDRIGFEAEAYQRSDDAAVAGAAEAFLAPHLESKVGNWPPMDRQSLLLAFLAGAKSRDSLAGVVAIENAPLAAGDTVVQGYSLEARYRLGGGHGLEELETKLEDPALGLYAARALVASSAENSDPVAGATL